MVCFSIPDHDGVEETDEVQEAIPAFADDGHALSGTDCKASTVHFDDALQGSH